MKELGSKAVNAVVKKNKETCIILICDRSFCFYDTLTTFFKFTYLTKSKNTER